MPNLASCHSQGWCVRGPKVHAESGASVWLALQERTMPRHPIIAFCGLVWVLGPGTSQELPPRIIGDDNRIAVASELRNSIGHVNIEGYRRVLRCSGIQVSSNI